MPIRFVQLIPAIGLLLGCRTVESDRIARQKEREREFRISIDSAVRAERVKGIFIDTTNGNGALHLPLMIFSEPQFRRLRVDATSTRVSRIDSGYANFGMSEFYSVGVRDDAGQVTFEPGLAAVLPRFYPATALNAATNTATASRTTIQRLEAIDTPDPKEFPASALTMVFGHPSPVLEDLIDEQLKREGWPSRVDRQLTQDSTIVSFITKYLKEPDVPNEMRERHTAFMISLFGGRGRRCTHVAIRWLTKSKGIRESTWATLDADSLYEPATRLRLSDWFKNLERCPRR